MPKHICNDSGLPTGQVILSDGTILGNQSFAQHVHEVVVQIEDMLVEKNISYGNSALNPLRVFSRADTTEQLRVRIDDKLSRIARGVRSTSVGEDTLNDLIGYLILLKIATNTESQ